jgi:hypothetical protein
VRCETYIVHVMKESSHVGLERRSDDATCLPVGRGDAQTKLCDGKVFMWSRVPFFVENEIQKMELDPYLLADLTDNIFNV